MQQISIESCLKLFKRKNRLEQRTFQEREADGAGLAARGHEGVQGLELRGVVRVLRVQDRQRRRLRGLPERVVKKKIGGREVHKECAVDAKIKILLR